MNPGTLEEVKKIVAGIKKTTAKIKGVTAMVCPPFVYTQAVSKLNSGKTFALGAQDVFYEVSGSYTGQISPLMLKNSGVTHVLIGHSEKRGLGDTDEIINKKLTLALKEELTVVLCIGEKERDVDGKYFEFLKDQLKNALNKVQKKNLAQLVIGYEPIWAIGKSDKEAMSGADMHEMAIFIRKTLSDLFGKEDVAMVPILYGGSVGPQNAGDLVSLGHIDGFVLGRQSLLPEGFSEILKIVEKI